MRNSAGTWVQSRVRPMVAKRISSLITHDELLSLLKDEFQLPDNTSVQYVLLNTKNQVIDPGENFLSHRFYKGITRLYIGVQPTSTCTAFPKLEQSIMKNEIENPDIQKYLEGMVEIDIVKN